MNFPVPLRVLSLWGITLVIGCSSLPSIQLVSKPQEIPPAKVSAVLVSWSDRIHTTSDSVNQGAQLRGLAGRVFLFGEDNKAVDATGHIAVELFDMTPAASGGQPTKLAEWKYDPETLKRLKRKDKVGDGYTIFLPWDNYRPDIAQVRLQLAYLPEVGAPNYTDPEVVTLRSEAPPPLMQSNQVVPASYRSDKK